MPILPRVSIVTPSYNQVEFLENTILSVLEQDYPNLEYIIMDGGSSDGSVRIIEKYHRYLTYWQSGPDGGQVEAINSGFQKATGEIFAFINSDDFYLQGAVQHIVELYHEYPTAAGWVGGGYSITRDGYILRTRLPQKVGHADLANVNENWFHQPACFFSSRIAHAVGLLNPKYKNAFDSDFWMKITKMGILIPTTKIIAAVTIHPETKTQKNSVRMYEEVQDIQRTFGYISLAQISQSFIDQAQRAKPIGMAAKLLYVTQNQKRKAPDKYVRFPVRPKGESI